MDLKKNLTGGGTVFAPPTGLKSPSDSKFESASAPPPPDLNIVVHPVRPRHLYMKRAGWCKNCSTAPGLAKGIEYAILRLGARGLINEARLRQRATQEVGGAKTVPPPVARRGSTWLRLKQKRSFEATGGRAQSPQLPPSRPS